MITLGHGVAYLTKQEVCEALEISLSSLNKLIAGNQIPYVKLKIFTDRKYRIVFDKAALDAWILSNAEPSKN